MTDALHSSYANSPVFFFKLSEVNFKKMCLFYSVYDGHVEPISSGIREHLVSGSFKRRASAKRSCAAATQQNVCLVISS